MASFTTSPNVKGLLFIGLVFHVIYIMSVFDCYFTSPVVQGVRHFTTDDADADRLVLIIGDGLRADLLFNRNPFPLIPNSPEIVAPYLYSVVENRGAFGISHTRVPTESRPGHVALIAGMYEDVSAVTKGWKTNPVDFDSVFNQSTKTFSFGSPDILPMFARGATPGRVDEWSYEDADEDFTKDAKSLDTWVLDTMTALFKNASINHVLDKELRAPGTIFFMHLLGLDTTGHAYRPHSKEYMENIQHVDSIVQQTEALFEKFYGPTAKRTAYVFTADHGMSNLGNHGDGHPDNTRTPLIAWGSGVRGPIPRRNGEPSVAWGLALHEESVSQADIAPLMSTLLGKPLPANSVGVLPYRFLSRDLERTTRAMVVNAKAILEQYRVKHAIKAAHALRYKPYPKLPGNSVPGAHEISELETLLSQSHWEKAQIKSMELINHALDGLQYLQTYDRTLLGSIVTLGYLGWTLYSGLFVMRHYGAPSPRNLQRSFIPHILGLSIFAITSALFAKRKSPLTYYAYAAFPVWFWSENVASILSGDLANVQSLISWLPKGIIIIAVLLSMVIGYTHRFIWSIGFVVVGLIWPLLSVPFAKYKNDGVLWLAWGASCCFTAVFPSLGVEKKEDTFSIMLGGTAVVVAGLTGLFIQGGVVSRKFTFQALLVILSMVVTASSIDHLQSKQGLPLLNQIVAWSLFVIAPLIPFINRKMSMSSFSRLLELFMAFGPCFVILSISVEGLFYVAYSITLGLWINIERKMRSLNKPNDKKDQNIALGREDVRIAIFFLFFVQVAFFGTGNVASISSFYLEPVYRLVPIFNPFLMAALLIFKIVAPYVILSVAFATLTAKLGLPPFSLFLVAMSLTDGMTLTFFYKVKDTGSWLEIGQTISFFCITSLLLVWSAGICVAGEWLMSGTLHSVKAT